MLHSCNNDNFVRHLYGRYFQLIYHDKTSSYEELLLRYGPVSIHQKNIHIHLATDMYKVKIELVPEIFSTFIIY